MTPCTIVMYHYVRDLPNTAHPNIKGLLTSDFKEQIGYLKKHYHPIRMEELLAHIHENAPLPPKACLLTFDDGYRDHLENVFPVLEKEGLQGSFFAPAKTIKEHHVLDVNKIHFLLASVADTPKLLADIKMLLDQHRQAYQLDTYNGYYQHLAKPSRFDPAEIIFIKRLLQTALPLAARNTITKALFEKHVTKDEAAFAQELYLSEEELINMRQAGMFLGSHGFDHFWLTSLSKEDQKKEIDQSLSFLGDLGVSTKQWVMCYPYGAYNEETLALLKQKNCGLGLTTEVDVAKPSLENALTLPRLDTNDLPKDANAPTNTWFSKA